VLKVPRRLLAEVVVRLPLPVLKAPLLQVGEAVVVSEFQEGQGLPLVQVEEEEALLQVEQGLALPQARREEEQ
jgi:hypothetical protein